MPVDDKTIRREIQDLVNYENKFQPHLIVISGDDIGRIYRISEPETIVGRTDECTITIPDEQVSRRHTCFHLAEDSVSVEDLQSTNGTFVNGQRIDKIQLKNNDRIQIGSYFILKYYTEEGIERQFIEQLYASATKDFLTGCFNRRYFLDRLEGDFHHSVRHNMPLSLMIFDIDDFKQVNDQHSHLAGDMVLSRIAKLCRNFIRKEDLMARFGGEEFIILLRDTPAETAIQIGENLRKKTEASIMEFNGERIKVTISIGITTLLNHNHKTLDSFIYSADTALYQAKRTGKNKVVYSKLD